jgi:hypothetical protein
LARSVQLLPANSAITGSMNTTLHSYSDRSTNYAKRRSQSQPNIELDFETEAVWRNLRPEWFD